MTAVEAGVFPREQNTTEFDARMERLGQLLEELEQRCAQSSLEPARTLLSAVLAVHQSGLSRIVDVLREVERQHTGLELSLLSALRRDPGIAALLALHDLAPAVEQPRRATPEHQHGFVPIARLYSKTRVVAP
jgi:hypothetical protein